jgi:AcrR family transcriptional regulator
VRQVRETNQNITFVIMSDTAPALASASVNPPKQRRSRKTLERLVKASLELLDEEGPDGLTVHAVVDRAGSSVGSFYARFKGKDDLLDYLGERVWSEAQDRWSATLRERDWSDVSLGELVESSVTLLIDAQHSRSTYLRSLDQVPGRQGDGFASFRDHVVDGLAQLLLAHRADIAHEDPALAVRLALEAVLGVVDGEARRPGGPGRDELVRECRALVSSYLTGSATAEGDGPVDFFDVWG